MPLTYDKKDAVKCWPAGEYQATLERVEDKVSKAQNPMQVWTFRVYNNDGQEQLISEYVVMPNGTFRIKQFAAALGKSGEFEQETFQADDQIGSNVLVDLVVETQEGYPDKNRVKKIKALGPPAARPEPTRRQPRTRPAELPVTGESEFDESSIPF